MAKASPKKITMGKSLNICQNTGTGCRKTGYDFKKCICKAWNSSTEIKWKSTKQTNDNPAKGYSKKSFTCIKSAAFGFDELET